MFRTLCYVPPIAPPSVVVFSWQQVQAKHVLTPSDVGSTLKHRWFDAIGPTAAMLCTFNVLLARPHG
jgi:hypothetical protein